MKFNLLLSLSLLALASTLLASNLVAQEEFKTNSGESFKDPFADPEALPPSAPQPAPAPQEIPINPAAQATPDPAERLPPAPLITPPPNLPSPSDFNFPDAKEPRGARSQDLDPVRGLKAGTKIGTWNLGFDLGAGMNFNRRPSQIHFEVEGGFRLYENFDLNGIIEARYMKDRILGFYVMPNYSWRMSAPHKTYRVDLRAGLGTGWVFRGFKGNSYQNGYFPVRTSVAGIFYPSPRWAFVVSLDAEVFLFRVDTNGKSFNEISSAKGPPAQLIPTVGVRWEF